MVRIASPLVLCCVVIAALAFNTDATEMTGSTTVAKAYVKTRGQSAGPVSASANVGGGPSTTGNVGMPVMAPAAVPVAAPSVASTTQQDPYTTAVSAPVPAGITANANAPGVSANANVDGAANGKAKAVVKTKNGGDKVYAKAVAKSY